MNDLDCAKCQKSRKGTHWELLELLMRKRKNSNSVHLLHFETKNGRRCSELGFVILEREGAPSL